MRQAGQLITPIQEQAVFSRTIVAIVLVTFVTLNLQPLAAAAQTSAPMSPAPPAPKGLSEKLQALKETVHRAHAGITESAGGTFDLEADLDSAMAGGQLIVQEKLDDVVDEVLDQAGDIETEHDRAMAEFDEVGQWIEDEELAPVIQQRHADAVAEYQDRYATFQERIGDLSTAADGQAQQRALQGLNDFLQDQQFQRRHQPFDPDNLPFRVPDGEVREPATTREQFQELGLIQPDPIQVAAAELNPLMLAQAEDLPKPEHLEPTVDVQITQAIRDKAAELNHQPVEIYNWVRNTIEFLPTYGSIQGSDMTLLTERGNAFDTASLLIALLRASDIPARYVYGTVEIPIEQVMNWVGGVKTPEAALQLLGQGGIPSTGLTSGGEFVAVRMEHVWVEAWVDFIPSRGAVNKQGDTWVPMDGSFKQYELDSGIDITTNVPFDQEAYLDQLLNTIHIDETQDTITALDASAHARISNDYLFEVRSFLEDNYPDAKFEDLVAQRKPVSTASPTLPTGLPFRLTTKNDTWAALPTKLRHSVTVEIFPSALDRQIGAPELTHNISWPSLGTKRVSISYPVASAADEQVIQEAIASGRSDLHLYLVDVTPTLKLDDVVLKTGLVTGMGSDQYVRVTLHSPTDNLRLDFSQVAGDEIVVGVNGAGLTETAVSERFNRVDTTTAAENLQQLSLHYWAELDLLTSLFDDLYDAQHARLPSAGLFASPLSVVYNFGVPSKGNYRKRNADIRLSRISAAGPDQETTRNFVIHNGAITSYLEGSIFEQLLPNWHGTSLSTVQAFLDANHQGIPIVRVDANNLDATLAQISVSEFVKRDIRDAVGAGLEAFVPKIAPSKDVGTAGTGYLILDPETGSGAYRIEGGLAGAGAETPCPQPELQPLAQAVRDILLTIVVTVIISAIIAGTGGSAVVVGGAAVIRLGASAKRFRKIVRILAMALDLTELTFEATSGDKFCNPNPVRRNIKDRKNSVHNICANTRTGNLSPNQDVCVWAPGFEKPKNFDAYNGATLWEVKTYNFDNGNPADFLIPELDRPEWERESAIARKCKFGFIYTVGDHRHSPELNRVQPSFVPLVADEIEVDPVNCLQPKRQ